jgi:oxygen-dependent protoporphyrinogen oxidase
LRVFIGGALQPELANLPDDKLLAIAQGELAEVLGVRGEPLVKQIGRWQGAMPQYHVGHLDLVAQIEARTAAHSGLELAGNAYRGVGVPQCIHSGETAAERIAEYLAQRN